uniref:Uncharacterized protein n=1 Tax=Leersia perrieri TaxID=77586 RepID=A0A0D9WYD0_9ORYZ
MAGKIKQQLVGGSCENIKVGDDDEEEEMSWIGKKLLLYNVTIGLYAMDWWERYLFSILIKQQLGGGNCENTKKVRDNVDEEMSWIGRKLFLYNITIGLHLKINRMQLPGSGNNSMVGLS